MIKAYRLIARIKNNRLWTEIQRAFPHVRNQAEAARALRVHPSVIGRLLNMQSWPYDTRQRRWGKHALHIATRLHNIPEYLFDPELYGRPPVPVTLEVDSPALEAAGLFACPPVTPEEVVMAKEQHEQLTGLLRSLTPREREIVRLRFGLTDGVAHTFEEIGGEFALQKESIRQIEAKALRKLRAGFATTNS